MDSAKLDHYRNLLNQRLQSLLGTVDKARADYTESQSTQPDITDQATLDWDRNFDMRIRDRERRLIQKIHEALGRIDEGTFGVCESCGEEIAEKRLEARPVTTQCIECKTEAERQEKQRFEEA